MNLGIKLAALPAYLGLAPRAANGAPNIKGVRVRLEFNATPDDIDFDFVLEAEQAIMSIVQAVWIENWQNAAPLRLQIGGFQQEIVCPSFSNGMFPVIASGPGKFKAITATASAVVPIILLNVPQPYFVHSVT